MRRAVVNSRFEFQTADTISRSRGTMRPLRSTSALQAKANITLRHKTSAFDHDRTSINQRSSPSARQSGARAEYGVSTIVGPDILTELDGLCRARQQRQARAGLWLAPPRRCGRASSRFQCHSQVIARLEEYGGKRRGDCRRRLRSLLRPDSILKGESVRSRS